MAILRFIDRFYGSLELAHRYARLHDLGDDQLAALGLSRGTLGQSYLDELAALDAATASDRGARGVHAPA